MTDYKPEDFQRVLDEWCNSCLSHYHADMKDYYEIPDRDMSVIRNALSVCAQRSDNGGVTASSNCGVTLPGKASVVAPSISKPLPPDWGKVYGVDFGDNAAEPMTPEDLVKKLYSLGLMRTQESLDAIIDYTAALRTKMGE